MKFVAQTMSSSKIGSMIIHENRKPIGIVTDKDLRSKIATGLYSIDVTIDKIMTSPVITVADNLSIAEAQIIMLKNNVSHLCVTKDGSNDSEITGIITEHDIVVAQANNPGVLLKECKRAQKSADLKEVREKLADLIQHSLDKNVPINHIGSIVGEINLAITKRAIELAIEKIGTPPPAQFAWMNIGSQGRKEQLLLTDQDNAIVFEDVSKEKINSIYDSFSQEGINNKRKFGGLGLGLYIVKTLVDMQKGQVRINSTVDIGTTCVIALDFAVLKDVEKFEPSKTAIEYDLSGKSILV